MPTCFVIQPFDSGKFDKRFEDVYRPAIEAAGLEAYRVDKDPSVSVPIEAIEDGIRQAAICLADITADNPNVWYELGYAFAMGGAYRHGLLRRTHRQEVSIRHSAPNSPAVLSGLAK